MTVIVLENPSLSLRGELTRWLLETKTGVFVGNVSVLVREQLWKKICTNKGCSNGLLIYSANSEQGFSIEMIGEPKRSVVNFDGIQLIKIT